ncbi:MAG: ORF6N domain-containing protein [Candidatus Omnitrophica bacterium]|nr:ORF6N domain-containing protein [Candidatus Omnitrophota bacterium]
MINEISVEGIASKIFSIRGKRVMLDSDLAKLYRVTTKNLNKAVKRNIGRFPDDFMFKLNKKETESLRFQFGTSKRGGRRYLPNVFTQEGVAMLSGILNSETAIKVNIQIMRAFVKLRKILSVNNELEKKLREIENRIEEHDLDIHDIFAAIRHLMGLPEARRVIKGFSQKS